MAQNLRIDPTKRDYVVERGSPIPTDSVLEATYFALLIPQGRYVYGSPGQGSMLYTLMNSKRTTSVEQVYAALVKGAIERQVIATGQGTAVGVQNLSASPTGTSNEISVVPAQTQVSEQLNFNPV